MTTRQPISKALRFKVFKRDLFSCQYCGATPPAVVLEVDHIQPVSKGGKNGIDNLITACFSCNRGKANTPLSEIPKSLADKASEIAEREAQIKGYNKILQAKKERIDSESWRVAAVLDNVERCSSYNRLRMNSIRMFLERINLYDVLEAAEITVTKRRGVTTERDFKYFCGVCWRKIREQGNA